MSLAAQAGENAGAAGPLSLTEDALRAHDAAAQPRSLTGQTLLPTARDAASSASRLEQALRDAKNHLLQKKAGFRNARASKAATPCTFSALNLDFCPRGRQERRAAQSLLQQRQSSPSAKLAASPKSGNEDSDDGSESEDEDLLSSTLASRGGGSLVSTRTLDSGSFMSMDSKSFGADRKISVSISGRLKVDKVTEYTVQVSDGTRNWNVKRRYRQFEELKVAIDPHNNLPPLPSKSALRKHMSRMFRDKRQTALEQILQGAVATNPNLQTWPALRAFLAPELAAVHQLKAPALGQTLETLVEEASFLVTFNDPAQGKGLHTIDEGHGQSVPTIRKELIEDDYFRLVEDRGQ